MKKSDETSHLSTDLRNRLAKYRFVLELEPVGRVLSASDGVVRVNGLSKVGYQEIVAFANGTKGVVLSLDENEVGIVILGDFLSIKEGDLVKATGRLLSIPVSEQLLGRVIDPLGTPLDGKDSVQTNTYYPMEKIAPGVISRKPVDTPVQTGIKAIDSMIPIGRGQRELIIGDRSTGKTAIALDTIVNQKDKDLICIYVAIGQKASNIAQIVAQLESLGAMDYTIVLAANASDPAALQYIAPYAGCALGEYFMDQGKDALVVYDDLTKHAWAYRQLSLILKRPTGREAFPGDIFYLHSRLLERACRLNKDHGGGSLTALPIVETQAGDVSAYIPTNVISITDGQIYLESDLFYAGIRPAVSVGLSVSRVGGAAQIKAMKQVAGKLRLDLAQYRELAAFVQFSTDLDQTTRSQIARGSRLTELLKQPRYSPMAVSQQVLVVWAATNGYMDNINIKELSEFETQLVKFVQSSDPEILNEIEKKKEINSKLLNDIKRSIEEFVKKYESTENKK